MDFGALGRHYISELPHSIKIIQGPNIDKGRK